MERDWDYVSMADYRLDMAGAASHASGVIGAVRGERDSLKRLVAAIVYGSPGQTIRVSDRDFYNRPLDLMVERDDANGCLILRIARTPNQQGGDHG